MIGEILPVRRTGRGYGPRYPVHRAPPNYRNSIALLCLIGAVANPGQVAGQSLLENLL